MRIVHVLMFTLPVCLLADAALASASFQTVQNLEESSMYEFYRHSKVDFETTPVIATHDLGTNGLQITSMAWDRDASLLYALVGGTEAQAGSLPRQLRQIDPDTGAPGQTINLAGFELSDEEVTGLAFDADNTCHVSTVFRGDSPISSRLYTCDVQTGQLTLRETLSDRELLDVSAGCEGELYLIDAASDQILIGSVDNDSITPRVDAPFVLTLDQGLAFDRRDQDLYGFFVNLSRFNRLQTVELAVQTIGRLLNNARRGLFQSAVQSTCVSKGEPLNRGHSGAWFDPQAPGQGFLFDIYPDTNLAFVAWFTHDLSALEGDTAVIGDGQHRWLTAQGNLTDESSLVLTVSETVNGVFNSDDAVTTSPIGQMTVTVFDCESGQVSYDLYEGSLQGEIPIRRISNDQAGFCRSLRND